MDRELRKAINLIIKKLNADEKKANVKSKRGYCVCTTAPMGDDGLEGFEIGSTYKFVKVKKRVDVHLHREVNKLTQHKFNKYFKELKL